MTDNQLLEIIIGELESIHDDLPLLSDTYWLRQFTSAAMKWVSPANDQASRENACMECIDIAKILLRRLNEFGERRTERR